MQTTCEIHVFTSNISHLNCQKATCAKQIHIWTNSSMMPRIKKDVAANYTRGHHTLYLLVSKLQIQNQCQKTHGEGLTDSILLVLLKWPPSSVLNTLVSNKRQVGLVTATAVTVQKEKEKKCL